MAQSERYAPAPLSEAEVEALRGKLMDIAPRIRREHLLDLADALHDAARARRRPTDEGARFDAWV